MMEVFTTIFIQTSFKLVSFQSANGNVIVVWSRVKFLILQIFLHFGHFGALITEEQGNNDDNGDP